MAKLVARPTRVQVIWRTLVDAQGYGESPTMAGEMWDVAERIATAIRTAERIDRKRRFAMSEPDTRLVHTAEYLYPGAFFPEKITRAIASPTFETAVAAAPDESGYFKKDGWYAVIIRTRTEKLFRSADGDEAWVKQGDTRTVGRWVVGDLVHYEDESLAGDEHKILRSNIRVNAKAPLEGFGVRTRAGNFQFASDYDHVVSVADALA